MWAFGCLLACLVMTLSFWNNLGKGAVFCRPPSLAFGWEPSQCRVKWLTYRYVSHLYIRIIHVGGSETTQISNLNSHKNKSETALVRVVWYCDLNPFRAFECIRRNLSLRNTRKCPKIHLGSWDPGGSLALNPVPKLRLTKKLTRGQSRPQTIKFPCQEML